MCPSETGAVCVWPKSKKIVKKSFFIRNKKITNKQYEYFYPFKKLNPKQMLKRKKKRKCTAAVFASN